MSNSSLIADTKNEDLVKQNFEPEGCQVPMDDYSILTINGALLNRRTISMLENASSIYSGSIDILGKDIYQGSYNARVEKSFGTHSGGGALDIQVYDKSGETWVVREAEIPPLVHALRLAGFAAWYRPVDAEYDYSPPHIHAIAIGDMELSSNAESQLISSCGYFSGFVGILITEEKCSLYNNPPRDEFGGPILCNWMCQLDYEVPLLIDYCGLSKKLQP